MYNTVKDESLLFIPVPIEQYKDRDGTSKSVRMIARQLNERTRQEPKVNR